MLHAYLKQSGRPNYSKDISQNTRYPVEYYIN